MSFALCQTLLCISCVGYMLQRCMCAEIPTPVQLGSAIIAAVEEDAVQEEKSRQQLAKSTTSFFEMLSNIDDFEALEKTIIDMEEGRGKFRKKQKMLKYLYPLLVGVLIVKSVLIPLLLKFLTAISTSSFVMSKIALATTGFLALKWIFGSSAKDRTHLEIVHVPQIKPLVGSAGLVGYNGWDDMAWSSSNFIDTKAKQQPVHRSKYIPVSGGKDAFSGISNVINAGNGYTYPQYNYDKVYDGKPFL